MTVAEITTNQRLAVPLGNVALAADITGVEIASVVNVTQIATIDWAALEERVGALRDRLVAQVDAGLVRALTLAHA